MKRLAFSLLLLGVVALWGWTFVVMKEAIEGYGVIPFLAVRFLIAAAVMGPFAARALDKATVKTGAGIGLVLAGAYLLQTFGLRYTTASNCGVITGLFVVFVPIAGRLLFGERTSPFVWAAIGVAVVGLALLGARGVALGDVLTVGAAACYGLQMALLGRYAKRHKAGALAFVQVATAAAVFLAACPFAGLPTWPTLRVWGALLVTSLGATAVAFYVQTYVQQRLSAIRAAMIVMLEPPFAALFGYLLAGDRFTAVQVAGVLLMMAAAVAVEVAPLARRTARGQPELT